MKTVKLFLVILILTVGFCVKAQQKDIPFVGAEVFIEPGQTNEEIDTWFKTLKENHFSVCRIRMFEAYMKDSNGSWSFSLFDNAFRAAEKYGIKYLPIRFITLKRQILAG